VNLLGKIKIYELAKKLELNSKEVIEEAMKLGIEAKNHLSNIEEEEAKKIEEKLSKTKNTKKENLEKPTGPVIIRRQVIMNEPENNKVVPEVKKNTNQRQVGFIEKERKTDYNIVYRNKPTKPMTVSELFGKKETTVKSEENKIETEKEVKSEKQETVQKNQQINNKNVNKNNFTHNPKPQFNRENRPFNNNQQRPQFNRENRPFNRENQNGNRPFNRDSQSNNRPFNRENRPFNNNQQRPQFNRPYGNREQDGRNQNYNRRPLDARGIEKNIQNIMSSDIIEKETNKSYEYKSIDKQKSSRYDDKKTSRNSKSRKGTEEEISTHKLKDLKQEDRLSNMFTEGSMLDYYDLTTTRGKRNKRKTQIGEERVKQKIFELKEIVIPETISVKDLSTELKKTSGEIIKKLLGYGILATINNNIDFDTAFLIASEYGITATKKEVVTDEDILFDDSEDKQEDLKPRPPVIVVMGHVDHGKTSLLDAVRSTNVIEGEAGGITQAIGAYQVEINGREITFLDTPGHEAFTAMRARGAQITDIAILVVAANDGVMPQTIEAINHAKAAGIPIIVAINKIDVEGANPDKVKQDLMAYDLVTEEWGGDTIFVNISAKKRINIDGLLEMVLLVADMKDLKANPNKQAKGVVIEAKLDKTKGAVATMLVQRGTLDVGDTILAGSVIGRIRTMKNDKGQKVKKAGPSTPVEVTGFTDVPEAGDTFYEVKDEKTAKHLMERRKRQARDKMLNATAKVTLEDLFSKIEKENLKQLNIIVKADVQGSVEAIKQSLEKLSNDEVKVKVIHAQVGAVTESDVTLASVSDAIIIAFNVRPEPLAKDRAEKDNVEIKTYSVIYNAIEDVESAMKGMLDPVYEEVVIGNAEVRQVFKISNVGTIAGCYVTNGKVARNAGVRLIRDNVVIHDGKLISLKRMKDDSKEVAKGFECGIQLENYNDIQEGDIIEAYVMEQIKQ
jgi:translation initiation factor IF-2